MDMKSSISWFEGICQKIENVCDDVDNTISQAVGDNVKKFCSDVMQELLSSELVLRKDEPPKESCGDNDNQDGEVHGETNTLLQETVKSVQSSTWTETQESDIKGAATFCRSAGIGKNASTTPDTLSQCNASSPRFSITAEKSNDVDSFLHECTAIGDECYLTKSLNDSSDGCSTLDLLTLQIDLGNCAATQDSHGDDNNNEEHGETNTLQQETPSSVQLSALTETQESDIEGAGTLCRSTEVEKNDITASNALSHECTTPVDGDELAKSPREGWDGSSALEPSESGLKLYNNLPMDAQPNGISNELRTTLDVLSQFNVSSPKSSITVKRPHDEDSMFRKCTSLSDKELTESPRDISDGSNSALESNECGLTSYVDFLMDVPNCNYTSNELCINSDTLSQSIPWTPLPEPNGSVKKHHGEFLEFSKGGDVTSYPDYLMDALPTYNLAGMSDDLCTNSNSLARDSSKDSIEFPPIDMLVSMHAHRYLSHRGRSLKSYKKLLQDILTSKMRIVKDYKQLGIWHGDIFVERNSNEAIQSPACEPTTSNPQDGHLQRQSLTEWELL